MENQYIMGPIKKLNIYVFGAFKEDKGKQKNKQTNPEDTMVLKSMYFYKNYKHTDLNSTKPKHKK